MKAKLMNRQGTNAINGKTSSILKPKQPCVSADFRNKNNKRFRKLSKVEIQNSSDYKKQICLKLLAMIVLLQGKIVSVCSFIQPNC